MNEPIKIRLHVLTPIHIGCDEVYEPTSFIIDEKKKKLIEFDLIEYVKNLKKNELDEFNKVASSDNILDVFKTIKRFYKSEIKGREVDVTDHLISHYERILSMEAFNEKTVINQFTISKTAYNHNTNQPYIAGSSLKGSIRTAYLNELAKEKKVVDDFKRQANELESLLLEREQKEGKIKISTDPFRMVKVSDFMPIDKVKTKIIYAINRKKQGTDNSTLAERSGVYQIFEVIQPGAVFEGSININQPIESSEIKSPINASKLLLSLNKFYIPLLEAKIKTLKSLDINVPLINRINEMFKGKIDKTAFILSIGRHSGAEAVTIEGYRRIKIIQGKNKQPLFKAHATTLWLASETPKPTNNNSLIPFGWAVMEVVQ